jgi:hypothetical protein
VNPNKWLPKLPLFDALMCVYCGNAADSSDHTPPRCLLPKKLPQNFQAMTVPACKDCNNKYSNDERRAAALICTVSFTKTDIEAVAVGGWVHAALEQDKALKGFINSRLRKDGVFMPGQEALEVLIRVAKKTATGLLFYEFGRIMRPDELEVIAIEHAKNVHPSALVESHRRDDAFFAEVTPSGRELERQVMALCGLEPRHMPRWKVHIPEFFEYMFIKRSNGKLLCAMKFHDALTVLLECPWPSEAGPRRAGKPRNRRATP